VKVWKRGNKCPNHPRPPEEGREHRHHSEGTPFPTILLVKRISREKDRGKKWEQSLFRDENKIADGEANGRRGVPKGKKDGRYRSLSPSF